jgi:hypothetical protein
LISPTGTRQAAVVRLRVSATIAMIADQFSIQRCKFFELDGIRVSLDDLLLQIALRGMSELRFLDCDPIFPSASIPSPADFRRIANAESSENRSPDRLSVQTIIQEFVSDYNDEERLRFSRELQILAGRRCIACPVLRREFRRAKAK